MTKAMSSTNQLTQPSLLLGYWKTYKTNIIICIITSIFCLSILAPSWKVVLAWYGRSAVTPIFVAAWIVFFFTSIFLPIHWWRLHKRLSIIAFKKTTEGSRPAFGCTTCGSIFEEQSQINFGDAGVQCDQCYSNEEIERVRKKALIGFITAPLGLSAVSLAIDFLLIITFFTLASSIATLYYGIKSRKKDTNDWSLTNKQMVILIISSTIGILVSCFKIVSFTLYWMK